MERTLCIDGLPSWMTSEQLKLLCTLYGETVSAAVARDEVGRSLRFGLVVMASEPAAEEVIRALDGVDDLDGTGTLVHVAGLDQSPSCQLATHDLVLC